jgi:hypothetical protein
LVTLGLVGPGFAILPRIVTELATPSASFTRTGSAAAAYLGFFAREVHRVAYQVNDPLAADVTPSGPDPVTPTFEALLASENTLVFTITVEKPSTENPFGFVNPFSIDNPFELAIGDRTRSRDRHARPTRRAGAARDADATA